MSERSLSRGELYERVWSVPMKRLAPELGLSDVGLAKVCRRFNIPVPPRGHWARLQFGKAVERSPLPANTTRNALVTWLVETAPRTPGTRWEALLSRVRDLPPITVADGSFHHPLVRATAGHLRKGFERAKAPQDMLRVETSTSAANRALHVMDALLTACEDFGWSVHVERREHFGQPIARGGVWPIPKPDARNVSTMIIINRQPVEVALIERFRRRQPTTAEIRQHKKSYPYGILSEVTAPTGELTLSVVSYGSLIRRRAVTDTATITIETQLSRFMATVVQAAIALRRDGLQRAIRKRNELRLERRRAAAERVRQKELRRVRIFEDAVADWQKQRLQAVFLRALKRQATAREVGEPAFLEWLAWAEDRIRSRMMDGLVSRVSSEATE